MPAGSGADVLVVFPNDWAAYSPTLLNLVRMLGEELGVRVIALESRFDVSALECDRFAFVHLPPPLLNILGRLGLLPVVVFLMLLWRARKEKARVLIGVDGPGALVAQILSPRRYFFVSLEVDRGLLFRLLRRRRIAALAIQSRERLDYLFGGAAGNVPAFLVQNAPILAAPPRAKPVPAGPARCVFLGLAIPEHGIMECIRAAQASSWTLTVKGVVPSEVRAAIERQFGALIASGRLALDQRYVAQPEVADYLKQFDIGFCLYDLERIPKRDFNYLSSPSGKLFNYFAAGLPVIATDVLGLQPVLDNDAGVLVAGLSPAALDSAVQAVTRDYERYSRGSVRAAIRYDFLQSARPFIRQVVAAAGQG